MNLRPFFIATVCLNFGGAALAQSPDRPWYVGLGQDFTHQSNVLSSATGEISDTISTTTLRGGVNVPFGRQRAYANVSLNHQRYQDLSARNNNGYTVGAGLDWSTIERLSGSLTLNANRQQADFFVGGITPVTLSNIERSDEFAARFRLGVVTKVGFEAGFGQRNLSFTAPEFASREYKQNDASLGVSYRPSGILSLGTGLSAQRTRFGTPAPGQTAADRSQRQDLYITANWVPTGASTVSARVNIGKTEHDLGTAADFEGVTGSVSWAWRPTGRLNLTTSLSRDSGQETGFLRAAGSTAVSGTDFSQVTNTITLRAGYDLTGKITLSGSLGHVRRNLVDGFTGAAGRDTTSSVSLGANWAATRTMSLGCIVSRDSRSASGTGSAPSDSDRFGCSGQMLLD